jgi:hypothetical protein
MRRTLEETWAVLEARGMRMPRTADGRPFVKPQMPNIGDDELGFSIFRYEIRSGDYSNLTLPRTNFGRSLIQHVTFANTDLSESWMCWNDFEDCDFSGADLTGCDMRASNFRRCKFAGASLRGADLRRSLFEDCDFLGADVTGAVVVPDLGITCVEEYLTEQQGLVLAWSDDHGPEPPGG